MTKMLDEMDPFENPVIAFDFTGDLAAVDSTVVSVSPGGVGLLDGAYQVVGLVVYQRVKSNSALDKTNYTFRCEAVGGLERRVRAAVLPVRKA